jgi:hypothetical protein
VDIPGNLAPRAYLFAYATERWKRLASFEKYLTKCLADNPSAHLHGVIILDKNWFLVQEAYSETVRLQSFEDNALLRFTNSLLHNIQSFPMGMMSPDRYHDLPSRD